MLSSQHLAKVVPIVSHLFFPHLVTSICVPTAGDMSVDVLEMAVHPLATSSCIPALADLPRTFRIS